VCWLCNAILLPRKIWEVELKENYIYTFTLGARWYREPLGGDGERPPQEFRMGMVLFLPCQILCEDGSF
jgi:hypothetical protein